jgi:hypothetical protein
MNDRVFVDMSVLIYADEMIAGIRIENPFASPADRRFPVK